MSQIAPVLLALWVIYILIMAFVFIDLSKAAKHLTRSSRTKTTLMHRLVFTKSRSYYRHKRSALARMRYIIINKDK